MRFELASRAIVVGLEAMEGHARYTAGSRTIGSRPPFPLLRLCQTPTFLQSTDGGGGGRGH